MSSWAAMLAYVEQARRAKSVDNIGQIIFFVDAALPHHKFLTSTHFFTTYPNFSLIRIAFKNDFAHYLDSDDKHIKFAMEEYFSKLYSDNAEYPTIVVNCEDKERGGIQVSVIDKRVFYEIKKCVLGRTYCECVKGRKHLGQILRKSAHWISHISI